ncbi:MAG: GSCFA domain-containing protein [Bacteroidales bacterium]|nr:GSCFA domain-containing protein [Bacteroidales bacterium]HOY38975.1 GSCFA domain-containing protein [Bacteroidales bacterium]HQP04561.1 GSCFA domain-containing protein [Bacteroidales bacterium]
MNLFTPVPVPPPGFNIDYSDTIFSIGSCFAENISLKLAEAGFRICSNPSGVLFNPVSTGNCILDLIDKKKFSAEALEYDGALYFHNGFHGSFSSPDKEKCLEKIHESMMQASENFTKASILIVTFGTSWVYMHRKSGAIVANCHKQPAETFLRKRLEPGEIFSFWQEILHSLNALNPNLKIIFSISPVRHFKDGAFENQLSKAGLFIAVNQLLESNKNCFYFPAYEVMMDELRDYRFYSSDMLHPSETAIEYIWEKFGEAYFSENTHKLTQKATAISRSLKHRPHHSNSTAYAEFVKKLKQEVYVFEKENPGADFSFSKKWLSGKNSPESD